MPWKKPVTFKQVAIVAVAVTIGTVGASLETQRVSSAEAQNVAAQVQCK